MKRRIRKKADWIPRRTKPIERPEGALGVATLRRILYSEMAGVNKSGAQKSYEVWYHTHPLCRVILEPL